MKHILTKKLEKLTKNEKNIFSLIYYMSPFFFVLCIGLFFLLYNFSKASFFYSDQGNDLFIAQSILQGGHRPLVGPLLTAVNIYIPPTYYYILALFLWFGKNPLGTAYIFGVFNFISMIVLMIVAKKLVDYKTAIITGLVFSITVVVHEHGRYMWQPHPVLWFEVMMFLFFLLAHEQKRIRWLVFGIFSFIIAASIYPSALLLFFYVLDQVLGIYRRITNFNIWIALKFAFVAHLLMIGLVYAPLIIFEFVNGFPTYHALFSPAFGPPLSLLEAVDIYIENFLHFSESVANQSYISKTHGDILNCFVFFCAFFLWIWLKRTGAVRQRWANFFGLHWVIFGWLGVLFYRLEIFHWRSWYLLPIWILFISIVIRKAAESKNRVVFFMLIILVYLYVLGNALRFYQWTVLQPLDTLGNDKKIASTIEESARLFGYDPQEIGIVLFTPDDEEYSYGVPPILYLLHQDMGLPVSLTNAGNNIDMWTNVFAPKPVKYLICSEYRSIENIHKGCISKFLTKNETYIQKKQWLFSNNTLMTLYVRSDDK